MEPEREVDRIQGLFHIRCHGAQVAPLHIQGHIDLAGLALAFDHVRHGANAHIGHICQADTFAAGGVDQQILNVRQAVTRFRDAPHIHIIGLAVEEDIANLFALQQEGCRTADIARFQAILLGLCQIHLNLYLRCLHVELFLQVRDAGDTLHRGEHFLCFTLQGMQILTVNADHHGIARACEDFADPFLQVRLHITYQARIAIHQLLDGVQCFVIVHRRIDADPVFGEIDAVWFVRTHCLTNVRSAVADAWDSE